MMSSKSERWEKPPVLHWGFGMLERMQATDLIKSIDSSTLSEVEKYIAVIMDHKSEQLNSIEAMAVSIPLMRCDFTLRIELVTKEEGNNSSSSHGCRYRTLRPFNVYRRIKCSGGVNLRQFQDRILNPGFGWTRNYHGYLFIDPTDGSQFGSVGSSYTDIMNWIRYRGFNYLSDVDFKLAQLLHSPGDSLYYMYDLGDSFMHRIILESIQDSSLSTGAVELIDGSNACPPEDSFGLEIEGCHGYEQLCNMDAKSPEFAKAALLVMRAVNYSKSKLFSPEQFDVQRHREYIRIALKLSASVSSGAKTIVTTSSNDRETQYSLYKDQEDESKGQLKVYFQPTKYMLPFLKPMQELIRLGNDTEGESICRVCGSPHNLQNCSKCHWASYCSRACQMRDWTSGHKKECKAKYRPTLLDEPALRFKVGDRVVCSLGGDSWAEGKITALDYREDDWPEGKTAAYQIKLNSNSYGPHPYIFAPNDDNETIRSAL